VQPIPYSHKIHAGTLKIECKTCHPNPAPGDMMTFVAPSVCMQCHSTIKSDSPAIQQLAATAEAGEMMPWVRVYEIPSYVWFSHKEHLGAGAVCQDCHGDVAQRDQLFRESDISMAGCMHCHVKKRASLDCQYCHEPLD